MILAFFLTAGAFFVAGTALFDKVLKFQYRNYRSEWENAGKPMGFLWIPAESSLFGGSIQRSVRVLVWTFGDEDWMQKEPAILRTLLYMRLCILASWIFGIAVVILGVVNGG